MIERWCQKGWSHIEPGARKTATRLKGIRARVWIVLAVVLALAGREGGRVQHERHVSNLGEIVDAVGSIGFFYGSPQPNQAGSRVLYLRTSERGLGLYLHDLASGRTALLNEWAAEGITSPGGQSLLPLSPGDKFLPMLVSGGPSMDALAICDADSGKELARIAAPGLTEGVWLTPEKLAWLARKPSAAGKPAGFELHVAERQPDASWADRCASAALTNASCLAGLSEDTIAWMDDQGVHALNLVSNCTVTLHEANGNKIHRISYSGKSRQFLVTRKEKEGYSLWRLDPSSKAPSDFNRLTEDIDIQCAQWVNEGRGYAYLNQRTPVVRASAGDKRVQLREAEADRLVAAATGDGLFFIGGLGDEPGLGLWHYGVKSRKLANLVGYSDMPSPRATRVRPIHCALDMGRRQRLECYVYRPAHFDWNRKYPLLIGDTVFGRLAYQQDFDGPSWAQAMANCGAYVVLVERRNWILRNPDEWGWEVMIMYNKLKVDPTVDKSRVFLCGVSPETAYLGRLLKREAGFWKGVLLLNPDELPNASAMKPTQHLPKMLISAGKQEQRSEEFRRYQEAACRQGMLVEVVEHPNAGHVLTSIASVRQRTRMMAQFIFEE